MRKLALVACVLVASTFAAGCGSESVQIAATPPQASGEPKPDRPEGVDDDTDPRVEEIQRADQKYYDWLRSDYVKNLDPKSLRKTEDPGSWSFGPPTFEEAVDEADLVVSGKVKDLFFVPWGTLTTFEVDRVAKGDRKTTIYIMQNTHVEIAEEEKAVLVYDPAASLLLKGDRAVLLLREGTIMGQQEQFIGDRLGNGPTYYGVLRGPGQYRSEGDKVRIEKVDAPGREFDPRLDGKTEKDLMDAAEARVKRNKSTS